MLAPVAPAASPSPSSSVPLGRNLSVSSSATGQRVTSTALPAAKEKQELFLEAPGLFDLLGSTKGGNESVRQPCSEADGQEQVQRRSGPRTKGHIET